MALVLWLLKYSRKAGEIESLSEGVDSKLTMPRLSGAEVY
jgi:hypothetical protein